MSTRIIKANREYKDRLFCFIFGNPENRQWTLELYNAINGTDYTDPSLIRINTIEDVLYLGMHNDVSFIIGETLSLYESQSTYNPNMPLRMMQLLLAYTKGTARKTVWTNTAQGFFLYPPQGLWYSITEEGRNPIPEFFG